MVNSDQFAKRLQKILEFYDLSAATFAEAIDVGRSSISHILSGRNKPSLDFVMKVVQTYPEVELYWLLNGKGSFPPGASTVSMEKPAVAPNKKNELFSESAGKIPEKEENIKTPLVHNVKRVEKVILLYDDGSFEAFEN